MTSNLMRHTEKLNAVLAEMEEIAEAEFLERVRVVSRAFPSRTLTVVGGMGELFVTIGTKGGTQFKAYNRYRHGGEVRYKLSHSSGVDMGDLEAPALMRKYRDYLFSEMEHAEGECENIYRYSPMVACGIVKFRNGEQV